MTDQSRYSWTARRRSSASGDMRPLVRRNASPPPPRRSRSSGRSRPRIPRRCGAGRVLVEGGFDYSRSMEYPASGLEGNLLRVPLLGVSVGISSIAELQLDGGLLQPAGDHQPRPGRPAGRHGDGKRRHHMEHRGSGGGDQDPHTVGAAGAAVVRRPLRDQAAKRFERERPWPGHDGLLPDGAWWPRRSNPCGWSSTAGLASLGDPIRGESPERRPDLGRVVRTRSDQRVRSGRRGATDESIP